MMIQHRVMTTTLHRLMYISSNDRHFTFLTRCVAIWGRQHLARHGVSVMQLGAIRGKHDKALKVAGEVYCFLEQIMLYYSIRILEFLRKEAVL